MSGTDDRVVSMHFNNAEFQKNVSDTLRSLDLLKKSLNFEDAGRGFQAVDAAAKGMNLSHISTSIDGVSAKFLAMSTIAITALSNITSKAISAGTNIIKSLAITPILDGFHEYETNINSIQTILANTSSKGTNLSQVNSALDTLNTYSDQTIYNFSQMAKNIGTFTAAGVDLKTSTESIKGIANLAATSGSSADQASTAMYQLSQAIAAGSVHLQDWNSVVNAGMGGEVFQKALFETGKAMGTLKNVPVGQTFDEWKKKGNSFRQSLSETGQAGDDSASKIAKANKDAAKQIADANDRAKESIENANERVNESRDNVAKVAKSTAKDIADATKSREEVATRSAANIARAEEQQAATFESTSKAVTDAQEHQKQVIESDAKDIQSALDDVAAAQKRLEDAMKPTSADDLQAATDRLTTSQLDQADLAGEQDKAQRDQKRSAEDLAAAQKALEAVQNNSKATAEDLQSATRRVEDAEAKQADLADAVERARIRQNTATRAAKDAEEALTAAKQKGSEQDSNVAAARSALTAAQEAVVKAREEGAKREAEAAKTVADAETDSTKRRQEALDAVSKARQDAVDDAISANQRLTETTQRAAEQQANAAKNLADAEKNLVKTRRDSADAIASAHESAADRIKSANDSANESMQKSSWLTSGVLTQTLQAFTGDMTKEQLMAKGYTEQQAEELIKMGKTGANAARDVKTFSQLMSTVKESIGSGWAQSFRNVIGDFEEARTLFTKINNAIAGPQGMLTVSANARNEILSQWKSMGGRDTLLKGFEDAIKGIGSILKPIKEAFREIFPKRTADDLMRITETFAHFAEKIKIGADTADKLKRGFEGVFAVFKIVETVIKGVFTALDIVFTMLNPGGAGATALDWFAKFGDFMVAIEQKAVTMGGIRTFFINIGVAIATAIEKVKEFAAVIVDFFAKMATSDSAEQGVGRVTDRVKTLADEGSKVLNFFEGLWNGIKGTVGKIVGYLGDVFSNIGHAIADAMKSGNFNEAIDVVNVGLLGGILLMLRKFFKEGIKLDIGGGLFAKVKQALDGVKGTLKAMQQELKAKALMEIAIAMGVLTASILVLSLIDSANLAKALSAIAVGFTELVVVMKAIDDIAGNSSKGSGKLAILVGALIAIAGAALIMTGAIALLGQLSLPELATGLLGLTGGLALLVAAIKMMGGTEKFTAGGALAIIGMAKALNMLGDAIAMFGKMGVAELVQGMIGVNLALGMLTTSMKLLSEGDASGKKMLAIGVGMIAVATSVIILAGAVKLFSMMSVGELVKGLLAVDFVLGSIATTMQLMPSNMPMIALGMLILSVAMIGLAGAVALMGNMKFGTLVKGIGAMAAVLIVLGLGMILMEEAIPGALATIVVAGAMLILAKVVKTLGEMDIKTLVIGIVAMAVVLAVLAGAAMLLEPVLPLMAAMGIALILIGAAFVLFGIGALAAAKAFDIISKAGKDGISNIIDAIATFIKAIPKFVAALIDAFIGSAAEFLKAGDMLLLLAGKFLMDLLDLIIKLIPKIAETLASFITMGLRLMTFFIPDVIEMGFKILTAFLQGVKDHIVDLTNLVIDIVVRFANTLTANAQKITDAAVNLILAFITAVANRAGDIAGAGLTVLLGFVKGIADNIFKVINVVGDIIANFIRALGDNYGKIITAGADAVINFATGLGRNVSHLVTAGKDIMIEVGKSIANNVVQLTDKGAGIIIDFMNSMAAVVRKRSPELEKAFFNLAGAVIDGLKMGLTDAAKKLPGPIGTVVGGIVGAFNKATESHSPSKLFMRLAGNLIDGLAYQFENDRTAEHSVVQQAERIVLAFQETLTKLPDVLDGMDALNPVITPVLDLTQVEKSSKDLTGMLSGGSISPNLSLDQARLISALSNQRSSEETPASGPTEIKFEQNNYSPEALSTTDIYRGTKSQIAMAKEELKIS